MSKLSPMMRIATAITTIVAVSFLPSCDNTPTVIITYQPLKLGNNLWVSPENNMVNAGPGRIWMVYCISKIRNKDDGAVSFTFETGDLYTTSDQSLVTGLGQNSWARTVPDQVLINANTTAYDLGTIVFSTPVANLNSPSWETLYYHSTNEESVSLIRHVTAPPAPVLNNFLSQVSLPQNCKPGATIPD
jgi:hypothetical protein